MVWDLNATQTEAWPQILSKEPIIKASKHCHHESVQYLKTQYCNNQVFQHIPAQLVQPDNVIQVI